MMVADDGRQQVLGALARASDRGWRPEGLSYTWRPRRTLWRRPALNGNSRRCLGDRIYLTTATEKGSGCRCCLSARRRRGGMDTAVPDGRSRRRGSLPDGYALDACHDGERVERVLRRPCLFASI